MWRGKDTKIRLRTYRIGMEDISKWTSEQYDAEVANLGGMYSARQDQRSGDILPDDPHWTPNIDQAIAELETKLKEYEERRTIMVAIYELPD